MRHSIGIEQLRAYFHAHDERWAPIITFALVGMADITIKHDARHYLVSRAGEDIERLLTDTAKSGLVEIVESGNNSYIYVMLIKWVSFTWELTWFTPPQTRTYNISWGVYQEAKKRWATACYLWIKDRVQQPDWPKAPWMEDELRALGTLYSRAIQRGEYSYILNICHNFIRGQYGMIFPSADHHEGQWVKVAHIPPSCCNDELKALQAIYDAYVEMSLNTKMVELLRDPLVGTLYQIEQQLKEEVRHESWV